MSFSIIINPFSIICLFAGMTFSISGFLFKKYPPKSINQWYGYRTPSSKRNQERWDFAQIYSAKELTRAGLILILIGFVGLFISQEPLTGVIAGILLMLVLVGILIYRVETAINKRFKK